MTPIVNSHRWAGPWAAACLLALTACTSLPEHAGDERLYWRAPVLLPGVTPDLRSPGFWIARLADPDALVMDQAQIAAFNQGLRDRHMVAALPLPRPLPSPSTAEPTNAVARRGAAFDALARRTYYLPDGTKAGPDWWAALRPQVNLDAPEPDERYALAVGWADQRVLPVDTRLTLDPLDSDFDELQNSAYDVGTPFVVGRESADRRWLWTKGALSDGWVDRRDLVLCDRATLEQWNSRETLVVTAARAQLWSDHDRRTWKTWVRMGTRLPIEADEGSLWRVSVPMVGPDGALASAPAWLAKDDAVRGALGYTRRTIVDQAFKLLDRPYGWGDSYGEQDCSRFLAEVFATVGIVLPRNSAAQGASGLDGGTFVRTDPVAAKAAAVAAADPGTTLLRLDGHIMLYLGTLGTTPYVIHDLWAYTQVDAGPWGPRPLVRVINAVTVSTLELSSGSPRGSLVERLLNVRGIVPVP